MDIKLTPKRANPNHTDPITNEDVYLIYSGGSVQEFRVPANTHVSLDTQRNYYYYNNNQRTGLAEHFPSSRVEGGVIKFEIADLVDEIISRCEPAELARALISDNDVRENLVYGLTERYSGEGINQADRVKFLAKVGQAIHDERLSKFSERLSNSEFATAEKFSFWSQSDQINKFLHDNNVMREGYTKDENGNFTNTLVPMRISVQKDMNIGGEKWNEARDYWRKRIEELFPAPNDEVRAVLVQAIELYNSNKLLANDEECGAWVNRARKAVELCDEAKDE